MGHPNSRVYREFKAACAERMKRFDSRQMPIKPRPARQIAGTGAANVTAVAEYWGRATNAPAPDRYFIVMWLRNGSFDEVTAAIDEVAPRIRNGWLTAESGGRMVSAALRRQREAIYA